jgi:aspartate carbamoyltransferase catalytic subunit
MNDLIDIKTLSKESITDIFSIAQTIDNDPHHHHLRDKTIVNLFFENSTRTLTSFELAAKRLGAHVINLNIAKSSTLKGESLKDTVLTLQAMAVDAFIIRHSENHICEQIRTWLKPHVVLINAGDGNNQHPTQALLDCYTIIQHKQIIESLKIAIIGDIKHSRVANSLIECLVTLGNKNINLYGPSALLPTTKNHTNICQSFESTVSQADVIVMLRIQTERIVQHNIPDIDNYYAKFGLSQQRLKLAQNDCIVLHPGPINRGVEISSQVADGSQSLILDQVSNGVLIRQAVLVKLLE